MFDTITNTVATAPQYLVGLNAGHPVLVPTSAVGSGGGGGTGTTPPQYQDTTGAARTLVAGDTGGGSNCTVATQYNVPGGLGQGFNFYVSGAGAATFVATLGGGVTPSIQDKRNSGYTFPVAMLNAIGTNVYEIVGGVQ